MLALVVMMLTVVACIPAAAFTLSFVPDEVGVARGGQAAATLRIARTNGFLGDVQLTLGTVPTGFIAVFSENPVQDASTLLTITVDSDVPEGSYDLVVRGVAGNIERTRSLVVEVGGVNTAPGPATEPSGIELRLDSLFYADGQSLTLSLDFHDVTPPDDILEVALSSSESEDLELVTLTRESRGRYVSASPLLVRELSGDVEVLDDVLTVEPGTMFFALYFLDKTEPSLSGIEEDLISDFAFFEGGDAGEAPVSVEPEVTLTDDERNPPIGAKPVGTILSAGNQPVQIATEELILYPRDDAQLQAFLTETGGEVLASQEVTGDGTGAETLTSYLIGIDPEQAAVEHLPLLRIFFAEQGEMLASKEDALSIYMLALFYQLEGYMVAVNPRLQPQGAPSLTTQEANTVTHTMEMVPAPGIGPNCVPGDPSLTCVENVPALWSFLALTDRDTARIDVAVLDMGFATNDDFRRPDSGEMVECSVGGLGGLTCGPGAAQGPPTVGNSFFGDRSWHGTGVVTTIGGVVNNDFGAAGVGGQVVVPMLYEFNLASYAFELGLGMRQATLDGASCINISAGYPCRVLTNIGPDFFICSRSGRAAMCAEVVAAAAAAAGIVCSVGAFIPVIGGIACAISIGGVVISVNACIAALALFDDLRGPIEDGVRFAFNTGVPVVTIAGNALSSDSLPPVIRDFVDLSDQRTERWFIVPAMVPETIVVGAVGSDLDNEHFFGNRVDIWAPIRSAYLAPEDVDDITSPLRRETLGGTSASTPFITGLIAAMQAVNPSLDRNTPGLGGAPARIDIVPRIKAILMDEANTFSNAELVALGFSDQPDERRRLVNPLLAVQAAARNVLPQFADPLPDFIALGYDPSLNFREALPGGSDDTPADARSIDFGQTLLGTVVTLSPPDNPSLFAGDQDWFTFTMSGDPDRVSRVEATLRYPREFGRPGVIGDASLTLGPTQVGDDEDTDVYTAVAPSGTDVHFGVLGDVGSDNVYMMTLGSPELLAPTLEIVDPTASPVLAVCADEPITFGAVAAYPEDPSLTVPPSRLDWLVNGLDIGDGEGVTHTFPAGAHVVEVRAFADPAASDSIAVTANTCTNLPPTATILTPSGDIVVGPDGFDTVTNLSFADVTLAGEAVDPEEGNLGGAALVWTTNRTDHQPALLGTGESLTARLFLEDNCGGEDHILSLQATDGDGNPSTPVQRTITIRTQVC